MIYIFMIMIIKNPEKKEQQKKYKYIRMRKYLWKLYVSRVMHRVCVIYILKTYKFMI